MTFPAWLPTLIAVLYALAMAVLLFYGINSLWLAVVYALKSERKPGKVPHPDDIPLPQNGYPSVTVQLPMFNEQYVAERIIEVCCALDYPKDKLEIQVLDDSTDDTVDIVAKKVAEMRAKGHNVYHVHRTNRQGYKAGALQEAMKIAVGDFIAIFDADFAPEPKFLKRMVWRFDDPKVGMVQARWGHLNQDTSFLTKIQALSLDNHFAIEQYVRNKMGAFMNFNGTAGIWRRATIDDAGGWQSDTLTEDLDLSYRSQMKGWKFIFVNEIEVPAELPIDMAALRTQQFRWTKGAAETSFKLLKMLWKSNQPLHTKVEGTYHLTGYLAFPFVLIVALLNAPLLYFRSINQGPGEAYFAVLGLGFIAFAGTLLAQTFTQRALYPDWFSRLKAFPGFMAGGMGLAVNNTRGVFQALRKKKTEFVRTPKLSDKAADTKSGWQKNRYVNKKIEWVVWIEFFFAIYCFFGLLLTIKIGEWAAVPFQLLFCIGFGIVAGYNLQQVFAGRK